MVDRISHRLDAEHDPCDLIDLFNDLFAERENTRLVMGEEEPIYIPAGDDCDYHQVVFAHGFFSSALHEIAHWCIAGQRRRRLVDYGYWYAPDGRNQQQQAEFESMEVKPQALEWIFCQACQKPFRVSADNLNGEPGDSYSFKEAIHQQVKEYCQTTLPMRAQQWLNALSAFYGKSAQLTVANFQWSEIV